jgi:hypothetical protein
VSVRAAARPAPPGRIDALLALGAEAEPAATGQRLRWLRRFVLAWGAVRSLVWVTHDVPLDPTLLRVATVALVVAAGLAFTRRFEASASRVALPALVTELAISLPLTANHFFLELYVVTLLALATAEGDDDALVLSGLRWLTAVVLFLTGCQKLAFGHYWHGDFLAFMVGRGDRFAELFQWVLPPEEVTRLQSYDPYRGGAGPYRVTQPLFVALSNLVWTAELALPIALVARPTRRSAAWLALAFVLALQLGARELGFALLFANLLVLFAPMPVARAVTTVSLAMLIWIAAATLGAPGSDAIRTWNLW